MKIGGNKFWNRVVRVVTLVTFLSALVLHYCYSQTIVSSIEPQKFNDDFSYRKSMVFLNDVEIRTVVDSVTIVIPARTVGQLKEIRSNGQGGYNMFLISFILTDETTCTLAFLRKELVEKRIKVLVNNKKGKVKTKKVVIEPKSFVLRGEAEIIYRGHKSSNIPSIPRGAQVCSLLFQP